MYLCIDNELILSNFSSLHVLCCTRSLCWDCLLFSVYNEKSYRNAPLPSTGWRVLGFEPQWGARFSGPIQTNPKAHPASCTLGTGSPSWG